MRQIVALPSFDRSVKKLGPVEKAHLLESLNQFKAFAYRGLVPVGLGFKKIGHNIYEFRVGLRLRVVVEEKDDFYYLALIGSHDDVKRYLRKYR